MEKNKLIILEKLTTHNLISIDYFQNDFTKYKLLLLIFKNYYEKNLQTIEEIIEELPNKVSSRAHKLNCITDATAKGYLIKESLNSDMRKKYLKPSQLLIEEFKEYMSLIK